MTIRPGLRPTRTYQYTTALLKDLRSIHLPGYIRQVFYKKISKNLRKNRREPTSIQRPCSAPCGRFAGRDVFARFS